MTSFPVVRKFKRSEEGKKDKTRPNFEFIFFTYWLYLLVSALDSVSLMLACDIHLKIK